MLHLKEFVQLQAPIQEYIEVDGGTHVFRMALYTSMLLNNLGYTPEHSSFVGMTAALHDIGKLFVDREILNKPGKLTPDEFSQIKPHTIQGFKLMGGLRSNFFQTAAGIALYHHESWDGSGYPYGLKGEQIPLNARVVAVADVFDSLMHSRVYKDAWPVSKCVEFINERSGTKFDPQVIEAFNKTVADMASTKELEIHQSKSSSS